MFNILTKITDNPASFRQFSCGESLIAMYNCPLVNKYEDVWSHHNYFVYVVEGRKIWHTAHGSYDLREGSFVFVRKGAWLVEQFFDTRFCFVIFFIPDDFISEVLKSRSTPIRLTGRQYEAIIAVDNSTVVQAFFTSMMRHFNDNREPDRSLLELKFRELILTVADNPVNGELLSCFGSILHDPQSVSLKRVMEENFSFNLKLDEYAKLSARSLSAFKRDFLRIYDTTPGKWLMERRLNHAMHLLTNLSKTVTETAFESGFESPSHFSRSFRQHFGISPTSVKHQTAV